MQDAAQPVCRRIVEENGYACMRPEFQMNGQIVLCKGINDGEELDRTIQDLTKYLPCMESVSVVPVGLSKFREGLYPLEPFDTGIGAGEVMEMIEGWQKKIYPGARHSFYPCQR